MIFIKDKQSQDALINKANVDSSFKEDLILNPKKTIESFFGRSINTPEGVELKVIDLTDKSKIYIIIPDKNEFVDVELNEDQLNFVSGGGDLKNWTP